MDEVKKAIAAGISFAAAVKDRLGMSIEEFSAKNGLNRQQMSQLVNGRYVPDERQLTALVKHLGGTPEGWLDLWFKAAARKTVAV